MGMTYDSGAHAAPGKAMLEHRVEDYEKLAHCGGGLWKYVEG